MLRKMFSPHAVAVIGAAREQGKVGHEILKNLILGGFHGHLYPINPKADRILGKKCFPDVLCIKGQIDLAIIVLPANLVTRCLEECGQKKIPMAIIISAGFKETGKDGAAIEREMLACARRNKIRILGPNCLGLIDTDSCLNASFSRDMPLPGDIGFFSQSGALGTAILDWAIGEKIGFSKFVSLGNKADISEIDIMKVLGEDNQTKVILGYLESIENGAEFINIARTISAKKPVIITKSGSTAAGARAASSHTGSLTGSESAFNAAFEQSGIIRANSVQDLFNYALAFAYQPLPSGNNLVILTNAGGPGIMAADACERFKVNPVTPGKDTIEKLAGFLPPAAGLYNPVDILGDADAKRYKNALETVVNDRRLHGVINILTPQAMTEVTQTAEVLGEVSMNTNKPILSVFMGEYTVKEGKERLSKYKIPNYTYPEHAVEAFSKMCYYQTWINKPPQNYRTIKGDKARVRQVLEKAMADEIMTLSEQKAREILDAYHFNLPEYLVAETSDMAIEFAEKIGFPVVLKVVSPHILHKSDIGGIKTGIQTKKQVENAFHDIIVRCRRFMPKAHIQGVAVQNMYQDIREVIIGMSRDPQFGPLIMFGLGGIYVEVLKDVTFRIAPVSEEEAVSMVRGIRSYPLLKGVRGQKAADIDAVVDAIIRLSQLSMDFPEICDADINPLAVMVSGKGAVAVDARFTICH
ncbi:acetate--CoA ligase family protein [bacterium]|nr:acetate--CoA ligase family protein [bacterium]